MFAGRPAAKEKAVHVGPPSLSLNQRRKDAVCSLGCLQITCSLLATLGDDFVADALTFGQRPQASGLDGGNMDENVLTTFFRLDESKTLGRVKPFNSTCSHYSGLHNKVPRANRAR